ncbi:MAG: filamentous hemagglutinin N-terminal domain-containing protein [Methylococcales bacterium]|nr:filamentous hemagglutinin N-terminal domain-containing protein [Methylococcales bacterium]
MKLKKVTKNTAFFKMNAIRTAILLIIFQNGAYANPNGAAIIKGQVSINRSLENITTITNSPNAIVNWQNFNISQNEITRFIQQNSQSAVLNRVIGQNPSQILGQLVSNGQVFLINPNGIVFGANSVIDTQGLVASTLNLSNQDFLNGNYHFVAGNNAGSILNQGIIRAGEDGNIILIAPDIKNSGLISTEGGQITLAAGSELTLTNLDSPEIQFQIQAPENKVLNMGKVLTQGGAINLFAGSIHHSGDLNANSVTIDKNGNIKLVALGDINLSEESLITANNANNAGNISVVSDSGTTTVSGTLEAKAKQGGKIHLLGEQVGLFDKATIDVSGVDQGGEVLVGGDFQGKNNAIKNASAVYTGKETQIHADGITQGSAGKVIVWADKTANIHGEISAKGGEISGNGGFVETSAKEHLTITQSPNISSKDGNTGEWLIDPNNITIVAGSGTTNINASDPFTPTGTSSQLGVDLIESSLNGGANVSIITSAVGTDSNITLSVPLELGSTIGTNTLTLEAHNDIILNQNINDPIAPNNQQLTLNLIADSDGDANGVIQIGNLVTLDTNGGLIDAKTAGSGKIFILENATINAPLLAKEINISPTSTASINFNNTVTADALNINDGQLNINNTTTVKNLNWDSTLGSIITTTGAGTLNLIGNSVFKSDTGVIDFKGSGLTVNNTGTVIYSSATGNDKLFKITNGATFNNQTGAVFEFADDSDIASSSGTSFFNNKGTLRKTGGTNDSVIGLDNIIELNTFTGSKIDVQTGTLTSKTTFTNHGIINTTANSSFGVASSTFTNSSTGTLQGSGTFNALASGLQNDGTISPGESSTEVLNIKGSLNLGTTSVIDIEIEGNNAAIPQFDQINVTGNINLGGTFNVTLPTAFDPTPFNFKIISSTAGNISNTFDTLNAPFSYSMTPTYNTKDVILSGFTFNGNLFWDNDNNNGLWSDPQNWNTNFSPESGNTVTIDKDSSLVTLDSGNYDIDTLISNQNLSITNNGKLIVQSGLSGTGQIDINPTGTLELQGAGLHTLALNNNGSLIKTNTGDVLLTGNVTNDTNGLFDIQEGNLFIELPIETEWVNQGLIKTASGTKFGVSASSGSAQLTNEGTLSGFGTFVIDNVLNNGILSPGASPSTLTFTDDLTLSTSSSINIELAGTSLTDYDHINIGSKAILEGSLNITEIEGFTPTTDASFSLINCGTACSGSFKTTGLPSADYTATVTPKSLGSQFTAPAVVDPVVTPIDPVVVPVDPIVVDPVVVPIDPIDPIVIDPVITPVDPIITPIDPVVIDPVITPVDPIITPIDPVVIDPVITPVDPIIIPIDPVVIDPVITPVDPIIIPIDPVVIDPVITPVDPIIIPIDPVVTPVVITPVIAPIDPIVEPIISSVIDPKHASIFQPKKETELTRTPISPESNVIPLIDNGSFQLTESKKTYLDQRKTKTTTEDEEKDYALEQCNASNSDSHNNTVGIAN